MMRVIKIFPICLKAYNVVGNSYEVGKYSKNLQRRFSLKFSHSSVKVSTNFVRTVAKISINQVETCLRRLRSEKKSKIWKPKKSALL